MTVSGALLFFGQEKQAILFWSVTKPLRIASFKMRETMKFHNYQDQN